MIVSVRQFLETVLVRCLVASIGLGVFAAIAHADSQQITLSVDGTRVSTFADLMRQAESLAEVTVAQQFQTDPNLTDLEITILGERNGQFVSLLSATISRDSWQANSSIRLWARYFTPSGVLLGYGNTSSSLAQVVQRPPVSVSSSSLGSNPDPRETVEEALRAGRISDTEYWELMDALD